MVEKRQYRSQLRDEQASDTRLRICAAARELFERDGVAKTTIAAIAKQAGVSAPTVYAGFGSKASILRALMTEAEGPTDDTETEAFLAESDPNAQLLWWARWFRQKIEASEKLSRLATAVPDDPEISAMIAARNGRRRDGMRQLAKDWERRGVLRPGLSSRRAGDTMWTLTSVAGCLDARDNLGWSFDTWERWFVETIQHALFSADYLATLDR